MASPFSSPSFDTCIQRFVTGQTLNAAGPAGSGHVVYDFQFEVLD